MTKHTDTEEDTEIHHVTFIRRHTSFGYPKKIVSCSWSRGLLSCLSTLVRTNCRQDAAHNMHMNTDINTYTFSLNALLCPRRSDFEMKRCINKTLPAVKQGPCKTDASQVTRHKHESRGSSGYIPLRLHISQISEAAVFGFFFLLFHLSGSDLAVRISFFCPSQMGAVLHFEPVAVWESSTALPVGILVGYLRERVWSDQVPTHGPKNSGQHLSFWSNVKFTSSSVTVTGMHLHNVVQLQSGIWRRVDKNVRQPVPLVRHPI